VRSRMWLRSDWSGLSTAALFQNLSRHGPLAE
jgi:hypothetical protein